MRLYIIGNGFDLNHGMKTSYGDYREFLLENDPYIVQEYESSQYLEADNWSAYTKWTDLENNLEIISEECLADMAENYYPDMTSERTPGWDDIAIEVDNTFSFMEPFTQEYFYQWIDAIPVSDKCFRRNDIDVTASFVTFNYTKTLESIYNIPYENILHIHGSVDDFSSIQFGTPANDPDEIYPILEKMYSSDEFYNVVYDPAIQNILACAKRAYKNLEDNFSVLQDFLCQCGSKIDEVVIMGHSCWGIDEPYYENIFVPQLGNAKWYIYVHDNEDKENAECFVTKYKLKKAVFIEW